MKIQHIVETIYQIAQTMMNLVLNVMFNAVELHVKIMDLLNAQTAPIAKLLALQEVVLGLPSTVRTEVGVISIVQTNTVVVLTNIICPNSGPCNVICNTGSSCNTTTITQSKSSGQYMDVRCTVDDACLNLAIGAENLNLSCTAPRSCWNSNITATAAEYDCSGDDSCQNLISSSDSLELGCHGPRACEYAHISTSEDMNLNCTIDDSCSLLVAQSQENLNATCSGFRSCQNSSFSAHEKSEIICSEENACNTANMTTSNSLHVGCYVTNSCLDLQIICDHPINGNNCSMSCLDAQFCSDVFYPPVRTSSLSASPILISIPVLYNITSTPSPLPALSASTPSQGVVINGSLDISSTTFTVNQTVLVEGSLNGSSSTIIIPVDAGGVVKVNGNITITGVVIIQLGPTKIVGSKELSVFLFNQENYASFNLTYQIIQSDGSPLGECEDVDIVPSQTTTSLAVTLTPKKHSQGCGAVESSGDDTGRIIGIVVGTVVGAFIIVVVVVVIVIVVLLVKRKAMVNHY
eukprot:TRINITY_DN7193_c0_g1_i1.p1 TRINITY_DN7193_c0_g1~~TRINITY_DN7193_c0_g1_i1.p1  ORF type:complete len:521 (-),score=48.62 TRINITY_DN7193_c0_g1_i1:3-1565(-)